MKYILNPTPVRTSNNFGINDITIDFKIPKANKFDKMSIEDNKDLEINIDEDTKTISNRIGLEIKSNKNIYIKVPEGKIIKETVRLLFKLESNSLIDNVFIDVGKNSKVKLLFAYEGTGFHFLKQEVRVHEYANAHITISNMLDNKSMSFIAIENKLYLSTIDEIEKMEEKECYDEVLYGFCDENGPYISFVKLQNKLGNYFMNFNSDMYIT